MKFFENKRSRQTVKKPRHSRSQIWKGSIAAAFLSLFSYLPASAQTVLEKIAETGILKVAVREDAPPFGYLNSSKELEGYCLDFLVLLEQKLTAELQRNYVAIELLKSTVSNRFSLVEDGIIYLECGSNSIVDSSGFNVAFSRPFFSTTTQFLASKKQADKLNLDSDLAGVKIGVIRDTNTEKLIRERYPKADLVLFSGINARNRGVQALTQGKIAAIASDRILLRAEAAKNNLSVKEYVFVEPPLNEDLYGMIITANDPQWQTFVDSVISSVESQKLFEE